MAQLTETKSEVIYTLILNEGELKALQAVLGRVGGHPDNTRRKYTDQILKAIGEETPKPKDIDLNPGSIYFT